jgi:saccharopine dehydrogenase-like NADP-dependent oxidoreductase
MTSPTKLRVVVAGASGETGQSVIKGLLAVTIETADFCDVEALAERLAGADVVISCLLPLQQVESEALIDAAHLGLGTSFIQADFQ